MPSDALTPEWIPLAGADDPRDIVLRAVACLAQGGTVLLPWDSGYVLAASALRTETLQQIAQKDGTDQFSLSARYPEELLDWSPRLPKKAMRLPRRLWPGPLTLLVPSPPAQGLAAHLPEYPRLLLSGNGQVALQCPSSDLPRAILALIAGPLAVASPSTSSRSLPSDPSLLADLWRPNMVLDAGAPEKPPIPTTVLSWSDNQWNIQRHGAFGPDQIRRASALRLLFVCTGNTCRSPMAEGICRLLAANRLNCVPDELGQRGVELRSAGVGAMDGMPASPNAVKVLDERGGSLREHLSQSLSWDLVNDADWIIAMTRQHQRALLDYFPEVEPRVRLLHPAGEDVLDPIGSDLSVYRATARQIEASLTALLDDVLD